MLYLAIADIMIIIIQIMIYLAYKTDNLHILFNWRFDNKIIMIFLL